MAEEINYKDMVAQRGENESDMQSEDYEDERLYEETFEKLKEIGKELLFSGSSRSIENS